MTDCPAFVLLYETKDLRFWRRLIMTEISLFGLSAHTLARSGERGGH